MKIIISPAKKLNENKVLLSNTSKVIFEKEANILIKQLQSYNVVDLKKIMKISDNLSKLNYDRFQNFDLNSEDSAPAVLLFKGDVYKGLQADNFSEDTLKYSQKKLRILSGLYGILRPLDRIYPYRLEMGTSLVNDRGSDLYSFWGDMVKNSLLSEMDKDECLINLASNEYSKVLSLKSFDRKVITPVFKDFKNGKLKVISFFAKRARGEMANFILSNRIVQVSDLKNFEYEGYRYSDEINNQLLFTR